MSLVSLIGPRPNLLGISEAGKNWRLEVNQPILTNQDLERVRHIEDNSGGAFRTRTLNMTYASDQGAAGMGPALERLCSEAERAVLDGYSILILSDRNTNRDRWSFQLPLRGWSRYRSASGWSYQGLEDRGGVGVKGGTMGALGLALVVPLETGGPLNRPNGGRPSGLPRC